MSNSLWPQRLQPTRLFLSMRFSRQENWSWLPFPSPGDLCEPRIECTSPASPILAGKLFTTSTTWEAPICQRGILKYKITLSTFHLKEGGGNQWIFVFLSYPLLTYMPKKVIVQNTMVWPLNDHQPLCVANISTERFWKHFFCPDLFYCPRSDPKHKYWQPGWHIKARLTHWPSLRRQHQTESL